MSAEDTQAWLRVAAGELSHLPPDMLERGCKTARKTCTHHGQIVPAILKDVGPWYADVEAGARIAERKAAAQTNPVDRLPEPEPWAPTFDELEAIKAKVAAQFPSNRDA